MVRDPRPEAEARKPTTSRRRVRRNTSRSDYTASMVTYSETADYTVKPGGSRVGFVDVEFQGFGIVSNYTEAHLGPFGKHRVPISAQSRTWLLIILGIAAMGLAVRYTMRRRVA